MGADIHVRGWGRRALALFQVLALVALLGLQGAAPSDAAAGRNQDRRERPDVERDCPSTEGVEFQPDQDASDDGEELATVADGCPEDADAEEEDAEVDHEEARDHEADEAEGHQGDDHDEARDHEADEAEGHQGDDHAPDDADDDQADESGTESHESDGREPEESDSREPDEADNEHEADELHEAEQPNQEPADDAEQVEDVGEQPDDDAEPGKASADAPEEEPSAPAETDPNQGGQDTDAVGAEAVPESQNPTSEAGDSSGSGHQDANSQGAGSGGPQTGGSSSGGPEGDAGASRGDPGDPRSDEEAHDIEPAPIAAAPAVSGYSLTGSFSTVALLDALPSRRALRSRESVPQIAPFIVAGPASWTDTWGAPRSGPGSLARRHEGQDVFCRYGDPVLASERGYVEFDEGGLGGKVARLHRIDGSYWYYAHLSAWNTRDFSSGDQVVQGDVIGYCGNSGNAAGSPPHVHFGLYGANGQAINPMRDLVHWLRAAEGKPLVARLDNRDSNSDTSSDLTLKSSLEEVLLQRIPRLDGTGDAFGDSSAGLENPRNHQSLAASSTLPEAVIAVVAIATLFLWGGLSVRGAFTSA